MDMKRGFTPTELAVAVVVVVLLGATYYASQSSLYASHRDTQRKTAINAIYYNLVEVVKPTLGGYPRVLTAEQLKAMDTALLTDPRGQKIGAAMSEYRYEPTECNGGDICQSFTLHADLEREDVFVKRSPR